MSIPSYEVLAVRYATRDAMRSSHFIGGDPHDGPMPMDYFLWVIRNHQRTIVVDTGFTAEVAARRKRTYLRSPREALALVGVNASDVEQVIVTHLHYDHGGTFADFPNARFCVQDDEMQYATGRFMAFPRFSHSYEVEDIVGLVRLVFKSRVDFCSGTAEIAPGVSVHRIGGHSAGLQSVRVMTDCGWVVLASDATHYYEHMETKRCFPTVFHVGEMVEGFGILRQLAASPRHIVPGHDPLVMKRYPAASRELEGIAVRVDVPAAL